jgi:hypothetical protein
MRFSLAKKCNVYIDYDHFHYHCDTESSIFPCIGSTSGLVNRSLEKFVNERKIPTVSAVRRVLHVANEALKFQYSKEDIAVKGWCYWN